MALTTPETHPVVVIGAGPAGLATAGSLNELGIRALVVERADAAGASWRGHYDRLRLHTVRWLSQLPGLRIPAEEGRYVSRDGVVRYLESYVEHHGLDVRCGFEVSGIEREGDAWLLRSPQGDLRTRQVVVATGYNHTPAVPEWEGRDRYRGELIHAASYRNGAPYVGRSVLVVGTGNTGAEIAVDLVEHGAALVRLAYRTPPYIMRRDFGPIPSQVTGIVLRDVPAAIADRLAEPVRRLSVPDLSARGLPDPGMGLYKRAKRGEIPILDVGLIELIESGRVEPVPTVRRFDRSRVELVDGRVIEPDAVIAATGYERGLESLVGHLRVLGKSGRPMVHGERTFASAPGLRFIGFTNPVSGMFREIALDSGRIAHAVRADLLGDVEPARGFFGLRALVGWATA
jgi:putative flavoprotein involved in K+ transport